MEEMAKVGFSPYKMLYTDLGAPDGILTALLFARFRTGARLYDALLRRA